MDVIVPLNFSNRRRFLRRAAGVAAGIAAVPALSSVAAAHWPVELNIDIQPDSEDNTMDLDEDNHVSVAVFRSEFINGDGDRETFDPNDEPVQYRFGSRATLENGQGANPNDDWKIKSVETGHGESHDALVLSFPLAGTGLDNTEDVGWLYWDRDNSREHGYSGIDDIAPIVE